MRPVRRADHEAGTDGIAQFPQIAQTLHPILEAHVCRVERFVVLLRGGLMPQEVPVRAGFPRRRSQSCAWNHGQDRVLKGRL